MMPEDSSYCWKHCCCWQVPPGLVPDFLHHASLSFVWSVVLYVMRLQLRAFVCRRRWNILNANTFMCSVLQSRPTDQRIAWRHCESCNLTDAATGRMLPGAGRWRMANSCQEDRPGWVMYAGNCRASVHCTHNAVGIISGLEESGARQDTGRSVCVYSGRAERWPVGGCWPTSPTRPPIHHRPFCCKGAHTICTAVVSPSGPYVLQVCDWLFVGRVA